MSEEKNHLNEEQIILENMKREKELNEVILKVAKIEDDEERLQDILFGLKIGKKRQNFEAFKIFVSYKEDWPEEDKRKYLEQIEESEEIYNQIEEEIARKLGWDIERIDYAQPRRPDEKDTVPDFHEYQVDLLLVSSLDAIETSQNILKREIPEFDISTEEKAKEVLEFLNEIEFNGVNWLRYLKKQKELGSFDFVDDKIKKLFNKTIIATKETLDTQLQKRQEILEAYPELDEENEHNTNNQEENNQNDDYENENSNENDNDNHVNENENDEHDNDHGDR